MKRLTRAYRTQGIAGIASRRRGRCPGNAIGDAVRQQALSVIKARYINFGPTFAHEKLTALHDCHCSVETLRKWMIKAGLWLGKQRKKAAIHQSRARRFRFGELVQIDGSPHDWFEGRAPRCTLIVFIDNATSRLLALHFSPTETTQAYMETLNQQLDKQGRPGALYSDKHSIFRVNHVNKEGETPNVPVYSKPWTSNLFTVTVCEDFNGSVTLLHKGKILAYRTLRQGEAAVMIADGKTAHNHVEQALQQQQQKYTWKPAPDHPWRRPLTRSLTNTAL